MRYRRYVKRQKLFYCKASGNLIKTSFIDLLIQAGENITAVSRIERKGDEFND